MMRGLNLGSGQRCFHSTPEIEWVNLDVVSRPPNVPDVVCDARDLSRFFADDTFDYVVLHQVAEHWGCGEAPFGECRRVLKPSGSLLIFLPDIRALALRWLSGEIDDYIYIVNLMGAYQGLETDRHRWHYTVDGLTRALYSCGHWNSIQSFDWRDIPGASLARDWWVLAQEAIK